MGVNRLCQEIALITTTHRTIGLITTMAPGDTWADDIVQRVRDSHAAVRAWLEALGFTVRDAGSLHRDYHQMRQAGKSLHAQGINALVLNVGTWTYANAAVAAAIEAQVPVIVLPDARPGTCGLVGGAVARGGLAELGVHAHVVYGPAEDQQVRRRVQTLLTAACAAIGLRGQVLGVGGGRCMGMIPAAVDPTEVLATFGVEIDAFEQMVVVEQAQQIDPDMVAQFRTWMNKTFGTIFARDEAIDRQIRLYLALTDFIDRQGYDFVALKCLPELPSVYTSFCLAHAVLGDAQDHRGPKDRVIFSCEADINAALTMQILKLLTDRAVMFTDLTQYDFQADVLTTCNCGSQPTDFASDPTDVHWQIEGVHEFAWKYGGCCPQHVARPGQATMARLYRTPEGYAMFLAPVEVVEMPREKLRETIWERPHAYVKLQCDREAFFDAIRSNHVHLVYGDCRDELVEVCRVLGVRPVVV